MKRKIISFALCLALAAESVPTWAFVPETVESVSEALTNVTETKVTLRENGKLPLAASGYDGRTDRIDPRYPGAYYTFDEPLNTDTLTLAHIGNDRIASFEYDGETNTLILFAETSRLVCGSRVMLEAWDSTVETQSGECVSFPSLTYTIADSFPNTGENLVPYGDFESGYAPVYYADANFPVRIVEEADGNRALLMDASSYKGALYPHAQIGFSFENGSTYKYTFRIRHAGMSLDSSGKNVKAKQTNATACALFDGTQSGATTHRMIAHQHSFSSFKLVPEGEWTTHENVLTVIENTETYSPEGFSVYTNPQSKSTVMFMLDDVAVYQRCDVLYDAGTDCVLKDGAENPSRTPGAFLDGSGSTAVTIPAMEIPYESRDDEWYIDPERPWKDENGKTHAPGETLDLADYNRTVTLTPNLKTDAAYHTVTFDAAGLTSAPKAVKIKQGQTLRTEEYYAVTPSVKGMRFNGWAEAPSDDLWDAVYEITPDEDVTLYPIVSYDFNFAVPANRTCWSRMNCSVEAYENGLSMLVTQAGESIDVILKLNDTSLPADRFSGATAYFEPDCFHETLDNLFYNRDGEGDAHSRSLGAVLGTEEKGYKTVHYDGTSKDTWSGNIRTLRYDVFQGSGSSAVRALIFHKYPSFASGELIVSGVTVPTVGAVDESERDFSEASGVSVLESIEWEPALKDGRFDEATSYTAHITLRAVRGRVFSPDETYTLTLGDRTVDARTDALSGMLCAQISFPKTESYEVFEAFIDGPDSVSAKGRAVSYRFVTDKELPDGTAIWSVDNESIATIDSNGRFRPLLNGTVTVKAISKYNPAVSATKTVEVSGQAEPSQIFYHSGTTETVTNMPSPTKGRGTVELSDRIPEREGYVFVGWSLAPDSAETVSSVKLGERNTDVYAVWGKGIVWDFCGSDSYITAVASGSKRISDEGLVCSTTEAQHDIRLTTVNPSLDPHKYGAILVCMSAETSGNFHLYYKSEYVDADGKTHTVGYNVNKDGSSGYSYAEALSGDAVYTAKGDSFFRVLIPMNKTGDVGTWGNDSTQKIVGLWFDPFDGYGTSCCIRSVAFLETARTVTFVSGTTDEVTKMPETRTVSQGDTLTLPDGPKRDGYEFVGWSLDANGETLCAKSVCVMEDMTLTAMWTRPLAYTCDSVGKQQIFRIDSEAFTFEEKALLVKTERGTSVTLQVVDALGEPFELSASATDGGYIVFDLSDVATPLEEVCLVTARSASIQKISASAPTLAESIAKQTEYPNVGKGSSSSGKPIDTTVTEVANAGELYTLEKEETDTTDSLVLSPFEESKKSGDILFNFDDGRSAEIFTKTHRMSLASAAESVLTYESLGYKTAYSFTDPYIETTALSLNADTHPYVVIKAKMSGLADGTLTLSYKEADSVFTEAKSVAQSLTNEYSMLVYDMSNSKNWKGIIRALRLSVSGKSKGKLDIDWLLFTDKVPDSPDEIPGTVERFPTVRGGELPFEDVMPSDWFYADAERVYRIGLIEGTSENTFSPQDNVTLAEIVTLAVRLNRAFVEADEKAENVSASGTPWYEPYVLEALDRKILKAGQFENFEKTATRAEVAEILVKAVPASELTAINRFTSISDVSRTSASYGAVLKLYRAGVLTGTDEAYSFRPDRFITRAETAAILHRMAVPYERKRIVTAEELEARKTKLYAQSLADGAVLSGCTEATFRVLNDRALAVSDSDDPFVLLTELFGESDGSGGIVNRNGADISRIRIGMKWDTSRVPDPTQCGCLLYYTTPTNGWSRARSLEARWDGAIDEKGVAEFVFEPNDAAFADELTAVRFDPFDAEGTFEIAYVIVE